MWYFDWLDKCFIVNMGVAKYQFVWEVFGGKNHYIFLSFAHALFSHTIVTKGFDINTPTGIASNSTRNMCGIIHLLGVPLISEPKTLI